MKKITLFLAGTLLALAASNAAAQSVPKLINYQGRLTKADGKTPIDDGNCRVEFRLWNKPLSKDAGNQLVWGAEYQVTIIDGQFNVILGALGGMQLAGTGVNDLSFAFGDGERYLGLTLKERNGAAFDNAQEIQPRQQLLSVPYAIRAENGVPAGSINAYGGSGIPGGWLLCDGRAVSGQQYPQMFAAISTNWGIGVPGTTNNFNVPDLRGLFLRGVDGNGQVDTDRAARTNRLSQTVGPIVGSLQADIFGKHSHSRPLAMSVAIDLPITSLMGPGATWGFNFPQQEPWVRTGIEGGSETRPKNAYVNYIIKY